MPPKLARGLVPVARGLYLAADDCWAVGGDLWPIECSASLRLPILRRAARCHPDRRQRFARVDCGVEAKLIRRARRDFLNDLRALRPGGELSLGGAVSGYQHLATNTVAGVP